MPEFVIISLSDFEYLTKTISEDQQKIIATRKVKNNTEKKRKKDKKIELESDSTVSDSE